MAFGARRVLTYAADLERLTNSCQDPGLAVENQKAYFGIHKITTNIKKKKKKERREIKLKSCWLDVYPWITKKSISHSKAPNAAAIHL